MAADVLRLPFDDDTFGAAIDRGCFHYITAERRADYAREVGRVLRPGSPFLLRACMSAAGIPSGLDSKQVVKTFPSWRIERIEEADIPSETRTMHAVVARMRSPE